MSYNPNPQRSYIYPTTGNAATGFSATVPNGCTLFIVNSAAGLATGTIIFPLSPLDGQPLTIVGPFGIAIFTLSANTGQTISGTAPGVMTANSAIRYKYSMINSTWYPN